MNLNKETLWKRFQNHYTEFSNIGLAVDCSRMNFLDDFFTKKESAIQRAYRAMAKLEKGAIANPDENRMVGHYWLRNPALAPETEIKKAIIETLAAVKEFTAQVHSGAVHGANGPFKNLLIIGIGGSALGPQFVSAALGQPGRDKMNVFFFDNTDPDGMDKVLARLSGQLGETLSVVISKSGGTKETRNGMLEAQAAYTQAGLDFAAHAVAITGADSQLDKAAAGWIRRFPMWDWVGGRTSEFSAVGLLPAALQGIDIDAMLAGARACDDATRQRETKSNPAGLLAMMWYHAGAGKGRKDMVVLPYKDRLELFSRYLQQLIMESLGKELDVDGKTVNQGIAVYGNKGATDQHAYIQQLRDGLNNFFVVFIEVLRDREGDSMQVEPNVRSGDFLTGFYLGTRQALYEKDRENMTLTIKDVSPFSVGVLIALFERAVGLYANLININAYHQPGVQAGKKAADAVIALQLEVAEFIKQNKTKPFFAMEVAQGIGKPEDAEMVFKILEHLSANPDRGVKKSTGRTPFDAAYQGA